MCMLVGLFVCSGDWGVVHRTLMPYQSLREKGSTVFFLRPFLPLDNLLFLFKVHPSADCSFSLPRRSVWAIVHRRWNRKNRRTCQQPSLRGSDLKDGQWFVSGWKWEIARFRYLGGDRRQIDKANFLKSWPWCGWVHKIPEKEQSIFRRSPIR